MLLSLKGEEEQAKLYDVGAGQQVWTAEKKVRFGGGLGCRPSFWTPSWGGGEKLATKMWPYRCRATAILNIHVFTSSLRSTNANDRLKGKLLSAGATVVATRVCTFDQDCVSNSIYSGPLPRPSNIYLRDPEWPGKPPHGMSHV